MSLYETGQSKSRVQSCCRMMVCRTSIVLLSSWQSGAGTPTNQSVTEGSTTGID